MIYLLGVVKEQDIFNSRIGANLGRNEKMAGGAALAMALSLVPGSAFAQSDSERDLGGQTMLSPISSEVDNLILDQNTRMLVEGSSVIFPDDSNSSDFPVFTPDQEVEVVPEIGIHKKNIYKSRGHVYQYDGTTCVPASAQMMLNYTKMDGDAGNGFDWSVDRSQRTTARLRLWARAHDTLDPAGVGSDPNGWKRALNHFGWDRKGAQQDVYKIGAYRGFQRAVKDAVVAIAKHEKPVGMLGWGGKHAQVITGYEVKGMDPAESRNFKVKAVYLSDPLRADGMKNTRISLERLKSGPFYSRLSRYRERDSHSKNGYPVYKEWYNKFTLILPRK